MSSPTRHLSPLGFFVLTFILSWAVWIPLDLAHFGLGGLHVDEAMSSVVRLIGVLMPAASALIVTGLASGRQGLARLLGRLAVWRVGWQWWLAAFVPSLLLLASAVLISLVDPNHPVANVPPQGAAVLAVNIIFLGLATLGEEIGWRGVALPALQTTLTPWSASAALGIGWAVWHIPFWLLLDTFNQFGTVYLVMNVLLILPSTFYITWFFNHSRGSLLLPVAMHVSFNIVNVAWLPVTLHLGAFWLLIGAEWALALAVMRRLGPPADVRSD